MADTTSGAARGEPAGALRAGSTPTPDVLPDVGTPTARTTAWRSLPAAIFVAARPRQWVKNLLVVAAPLAAGALGQREVLGATALALASFILASSATYLANDVLDAAVDRRHPVKAARPIASGRLPVRVAVMASVACAVLALVLPVVFGELGLLALVSAYLLLQAVYVGWAKHQPVLDLACVASGFVLRAVAGGVAASLPLSSWFLAVTASVAMFVVAGKRHSEFVAADGSAVTRPSLALYSPSYLQFVWTTALGVAVVFYVLWAAEMSDVGGPWASLSAVPFTLILLRYAVDVDRGGAEEPESLVLGDPVLLGLAAVWGLLFVMQVAAR